MVMALSELLIVQRVMPGPLKGDAIHVAAAAFHGMEYVLSWNVKHLANPNKRMHLAQILMQAGKIVPMIVTPEVLWEDFSALIKQSSSQPVNDALNEHRALRQ